jgi:hypothetical protein
VFLRIVDAVRARLKTRSPAQASAGLV